MAESKFIAGQNRMVATGLAVLMPLMALALYLVLGSPNEADKPLTQRLDKPIEELPIDALRVKIEARAKAAPDDLEAWRILSKLYQREGAHDRAITSLYRLQGLGEENAGLYLSLAENYLALDSAEGLEKAARAVAQAKSLEPKNLRARFYEGVLMAEQGETQSAIAIWQGLLADLPKGIPFRDILETRIGNLQNKLAQGEKQDGS